jgi:hypothetical protein
MVYALDLRSFLAAALGGLVLFLPISGPYTPRPLFASEAPHPSSSHRNALPVGGKQMDETGLCRSRDSPGDVPLCPTSLRGSSPIRRMSSFSRAAHVEAGSARTVVLGGQVVDVQERGEAADVWRERAEVAKQRDHNQDLDEQYIP